jgi:hypothetical protein
VRVCKASAKIVRLEVGIICKEDKKRPRFLNVKELAEMLRLRTLTVYDMVSQEGIPYRKQEIA